MGVYRLYLQLKFQRAVQVGVHDAQLHVRANLATVQGVGPMLDEVQFTKGW
jgi:hypothetical protein